jgi:putative hydrolase of HD superfamily
LRRFPHHLALQPLAGFTDMTQYDTGMTDRIARQLQFVRELDRLKGVLRRTSLIDRSRRENSAEHSWHLATMALALGEYAPPGTDLAHAIELLLVHDVVEIDADDTFAFDIAGNASKLARETAAAERIFELLPEDLGRRFRALWDEFEAGATPEARFANALDRFQALVLNDAVGDGGTWRLHNVTRDAVLRRMAPIEHGAPGLWPAVLDAVGRATAAGQLKVEGQSL